jgi:hypothetical protein
MSRMTGENPDPKVKVEYTKAFLSSAGTSEYSALAVPVS